MPHLYGKGAQVRYPHKKTTLIISLRLISNKGNILYYHLLVSVQAHTCQVQCMHGTYRLVFECPQVA